MRELTLTLPNGNALQRTVSEMLKQEILALAGGYTETQGSGAWIDDSGRVHAEPVSRFLVAVTPEQADTLIASLRQHARAAGELAVYYVDTDGEAHIDTL